MEILAIIPARGGSKGVPRKNIYPILGKPLIVYSIEVALASKQVNRIIVTTDDEEIAKIAKAHGAEVPFLRPKKLAGDKTLDLPVFQHALKWLKDNENYEPDLVIHLWPTSPLRKPEHIDEAISLIKKDPKAHSVRSITHATQTPFKMWQLEARKKYMRPLLIDQYKKLYRSGREPHASARQLLPPMYTQTGYVAVIRPHVISKSNSMFGKNVLPFYHDPEWYTEVDSLKDLRHTEFIITEHNKKKKK